MNKIKHKFAQIVGLLGLALALFTSAPPSAQAIEFRSQSFLGDGISVLCISNTIGATNLLSFGVTGTNYAGLMWTNYTDLSTNTTIHTTNDTTAYRNPFKDVSIPCPVGVIYDANTANVNATNSSFANIYIRLQCQSGANTACTFIFVPVPDGTNESVTAGETLTIALSSVASSTVDVITKVPANKWIGSGKMRLKSVTHPDADPTSRVTILACSLNTYFP